LIGWRRLTVAALVAALATATALGVCATQETEEALTPAQALKLAQRLVTEAQGLEAQDDLQGAVEKLKEAVALVPDWEQPRGLLGRLYQMLGQAEAAKEQYRSHQLLTMLGQGNDDINPTAVEIAEAEGLMIFLINEERTTRGLPALKLAGKLSQCARQHSVEMMTLNYFSHQSPVRGMTTSLDRFVRIYGCQPWVLAENLARKWGSLNSFNLDNIADSHQGLMKSPRHRDSVLWDKVEQVGVGIAVNEHGDYWITQMFARLR